MVAASTVGGSADWYIEHFPVVSVEHDVAVGPKLQVALTSTPAAGTPV